jgi:replicative DNA helicase
MAKSTEEQLLKLLSGPDVRTKQYVQTYKEKQKYPGIIWGIPDIDDIVLPMRPGDMVGVVARPGHAKTALLAWYARKEAIRLMNEGAENQGVFVISWETSSEEYNAYMISGPTMPVDALARGTVPYGAVVKKATEAARLPIYYIGRSQYNAGFKTPNMTLDVIEDLIELTYEKYEVRPTLLILDYLQIIPITGLTNKTEIVETTTPWVKRMAQTIGSPAIVAAQAARRVDDYDMKIPHKDDCQHSSAIEQVADKLFGLWRPALTEKLDAEPIEIAPGRFAMIDDKRLLVMRMLKQRDADGVHTWALNFDMATRTLDVYR